MKKNILIVVLMAVAGILMMPSCNSNADKNNSLQAPETTQSETNQATAAANGEQDDDDDDDALENQGQAPAKTNPAGSTDAKTAIINNLMTAFTGETTASAKYAAYAKKAQEEGFVQIALLFKATSRSEMIHADNHRAVLEDMEKTAPSVSPQFSVKTTRENLADAIAGEAYEISTMYPDFMATANTAVNQQALTSLNYAYRTEQRHKPLYEKALAALQNNQTGTLPGQYLVCPTCGNTYDAAPPKRCRVSMTPSERFIKINSL
ncbi:MAG TPA: rubrerythrin family protein [Saprospiraceae bacterium]|nr:rubrerythrin family protein [Saprospiraceae bacterium]